MQLVRSMSCRSELQSEGSWLKTIVDDRLSKPSGDQNAKKGPHVIKKLNAWFWIMFNF